MQRPSESSGAVVIFFYLLRNYHAPSAIKSFSSQVLIVFCLLPNPNGERHQLAQQRQY
jgi:hypothetical protein